MRDIHAAIKKEAQDLIVDSRRKADVSFDPIGQTVLILGEMQMAPVTK